MQRICLPPLTIQPLVENAIRHGVRIRKNGPVTVRTQRRDGWHIIILADNGRGFAAASAGGAHIGIPNVRKRIERICGGALEIESHTGQGATVTIRLSGEEETP